jgi:hypothetical protein
MPLGGNGIGLQQFWDRCHLRELAKTIAKNAAEPTE